MFEQKKIKSELAEIEVKLQDEKYWGDHVTLNSLLKKKKLS